MFRWNRNFLFYVEFNLSLSMKMKVIACFLIALFIQKIGPRHKIGKQEYSARTLGATWGIISAVMVPIVILLICVGWRIFQRRKQEEKDENDYLNVKARSIDPDESFKLNSDDESIPYKKDTAENSPEPTEAVKVVENDNEQPEFYGQPYQEGQPQQGQNRQWAGETEIN